MIKNIYNLGDAALYCDFGDTVNKETNLKVINYFNDIREKNIIGIKNPLIDSLIEEVIGAKDRESLITATKALDRILLWNHYVIPQWHISSYRVLYWDIFDKPLVRPKYSLGTDTWWVDDSKINSIDERKKSIQ